MSTTNVDKEGRILVRFPELFSQRNDCCPFDRAFESSKRRMEIPNGFLVLLHEQEELLFGVVSLVEGGIENLVWVLVPFLFQEVRQLLKGPVEDVETKSDVSLARRRS